MQGALLVQPVLFAASVWGFIALLRAIPAYRVHGTRRAWWLVPAAGAAALGAPLVIGLAGHSFYQAVNVWAYLSGVLFSAAATALLALGAALLWVGRRADPARGRLRCPGCWYDMTGAPSLTCPECGHVAKSQASFRRTRRSVLLADLSLVAILASYGALKTPHIGKCGLGVLIPTGPMIVVLPQLPDRALQGMDFSLAERLGQNLLWPWQEWVLHWRARYFFARSSDLEALARLKRLVPFDPQHALVIRDDAALKLLRKEIQEHTEGPTEAPELWECLPARLSPRAQSELVGLIVEMLQSGDARHASAAALLIAKTPDQRDRLLDPLVARIRTDRMFSPAGMSALTDMLTTCAGAWSAYRDFLHSTDPRLRACALGAADNAHAHAAETREIVTRALDDANDAVAEAAIQALERIDADLCDRADHLVTLARTRPALRRGVAFALSGHRCTGTAFLGLLRDQLSSSDEFEVEGALVMIGMLGPAAASLAPDLDRLASTTHGPRIDQRLRQTRMRLGLGTDDPSK